MEIKAELLKPYTDEQRISFIVEQNHRNGYTIEEQEDKLVALGYTEEEIEEQKIEHIKQLTCTKRVFALMLKELGVPYSQLKELIASNEDAQLEWDLCVELLRENPMLDLMATKLGITSEQLNALFLYANGEISKDDFELYKPKKEEEVDGSEQDIVTE